MALSNYQISYRGVVMGDGTNYDIITLEGLHDIIVHDTDRDNPRDHGIIPGQHSASFKLVRAFLEVRGTPGSTAHEDDIIALMDAMSPDKHQSPDETDDQLTFQFPGEDEKFIYARPIRRTRQRRSQTEFGLAPVRFELKQYDPRSYSTTEDNSGTQTGNFNVTNNGGAQAYPILEFKVDTLGGMTLDNNTNGTKFQADGFPANEAAIIADMGRWARGRGDLLIVYKGAVNHYPKWQIPRDAFKLDPGANDLDLTVSANAEMVVIVGVTVVEGLGGQELLAVHSAFLIPDVRSLPEFGSLIVVHESLHESLHVTQVIQFWQVIQF